MFDLEKIDTPKQAEDGHEIELMYQGQSTGWFVTVRGEFSPTVRKWQLSLGNKFRMKQWQEKRAGKDGQPSLMTDEDMEVGLRGAAVRIVGWRNVMFGGKPFEYSEANAYELVRRHPPFADQIAEASSNLENFTQAQ